MCFMKDVLPARRHTFQIKKSHVVVIQRCKGLTIALCGHWCLPVLSRSAVCIFYRILIVLEQTALIT